MYLFIATIELNIILFAFFITLLCSLILMSIFLDTSWRLGCEALLASLVFLGLVATVKITSFILKKIIILTG